MSDELNTRKEAKQGRSKQTVGYLLEATAQVLKRGGRVTTNHIANLAGVSIGTLYQYFPNKDSLLRRYIEKEMAQIVDEFVQTAEEIRHTETSLQPVMDQIVDYFVRVYSDKRNIFQFFFFRKFVMGLEDEVAWAEDQHIKVIEGVLRASKEVALSDPKRTSYVIVQASLGVMRSTWVRKTSPSEAELGAELKKLIRGYLAEGGKC
ncbi:MAG: TetR/AcrR family transcriptional regulator [Bdellovibrionales bacterium]|nr:TetR/AcrR family transcriptional regulator [Bdellovibrionales bacterium]